MSLFGSLVGSFRPASFALGKLDCIEGHADELQACNYGEVLLSHGELVAIYPRWWPKIASRWEAIQHTLLRSLPEDVCRAYYAFPRRAPGYMTVIYAHSGPNTHYRTLYRGVKVMEDIARLRNTKAMVCESVNARVDERLLNRWGYVKHAVSLGGNHYIKRLRDSSRS